MNDAVQDPKPCTRCALAATVCAGRRRADEKRRDRTSAAAGAALRIDAHVA